jgi:hypothetical protein
MARLAGASEDRAWWSQFGIAAGAVLAITGELAPLTAMLGSVPVATPSRISEIVHCLSNRRIAMTAALVCILVLIFGPMIVHGLRLAVLSLRHSEVDRDRRLVEALEDQHKMYMELHERGWSVTKTLSDIACNTPLDIEVDLIRITAADRGFVMMGKALGRASENLTARDNVVLMQKNLHDTGMFKDVTFTIEKGDFSGRYNFDLSARIDRPFHPFDYASKAKERDFAVWTHLDRIMGKSLEDVTEASRLASATREGDGEPVELVAAADSEDSARDSTTPDAGSDATASDGRSGSAPTRLSSRPGPLTSRASGASTGGGPASFSEVDERPVTNAPVTVPAAITQAQVDAMSQEEVKSALSNVSKARQLASLSDEDKERLKNEFNMLLKRLRSF